MSLSLYTWSFHTWRFSPFSLPPLHFVCYIFHCCFSYYRSVCKHVPFTEVRVTVSDVSVNWRLLSDFQRDLGIQEAVALRLGTPVTSKL